LACQALQQWGLTSHSHERIYTLGVDGDKRIGMNIGGEGDNGDRKRISPI